MYRELLQKLSPISHRTLANHYRVPMYASDDVYVISVGDKYSRSFYPGELPDTVRSKIAMVLASPVKHLYTINEIRSSHVYIYNNTQYPELEEVGWRVADKLLCLVLPYKTIDSLRGELLTHEDKV